LVDTLKTSNGLSDNLISIHYKYYEPIFRQERRAMLGFQKFVCIYSLENKKDSLSFVEDNYAKILVPAKFTTLQNNKKINEKIFNDVLAYLPGNRYIYRYGINYNYDLLSNSATISANNLNNHGRVIESLEKLIMSSILSIPIIMFMVMRSKKQNNIFTKGFVYQMEKRKRLLKRCLPPNNMELMA
jgi:hypothetical protein